MILLPKYGLLTAAIALLLAGCGVEAPPESVFAARDFGGPAARPCADREPLRRALWGDLHVHTAYSSDAWGFGLRLKPQDAYRYAFVLRVGTQRRGQGAGQDQADHVALFHPRQGHLW